MGDTKARKSISMPSVKVATWRGSTSSAQLLRSRSGPTPSRYAPSIATRRRTDPGSADHAIHSDPVSNSTTDLLTPNPRRPGFARRRIDVGAWTVYSRNQLNSAIKEKITPVATIMPKKNIPEKIRESNFRCM